MDRITVLAAGFMASPLGPKGKTQEALFERMKWAHMCAVQMAVTRCDHIGHDMRRYSDGTMASGGFEKCYYCSHEKVPK